MLEQVMIVIVVTLFIFLTPSVVSHMCLKEIENRSIRNTSELVSRVKVIVRRVIVLAVCIIATISIAFAINHV